MVFQGSRGHNQPSKWQKYVHATHDFMAYVRYGAEITGSHSTQIDYIE